jgi:hypothetical protein
VDALPPSFESKGDATFPFVLSTAAPGRVPDRHHRLLQLGLRAAPDQAPADIIHEAVAGLGLGAEPIVARADHWPEADLNSRYDAAHMETTGAVKALLPAGIALIGSDFCLSAPTVEGIARLRERISMGRKAALAAETTLKARRRR